MQEAARLLASDPAAAARRAEARLAAAPNDVRARLVLGAAKRRLGDLDAAWRLLGPLTIENPQAAFAKSEASLAAGALAETCKRRGDLRGALGWAAQCRQVDPDSDEARSLEAACLAEAGDADKAAAIYADLITRHPEEPRLQLSLGHALRTLARRAEAVAAYQRALGLDPGFGEAAWSLADLAPASFDPAQPIPNDVAGAALAGFHYARGRALEAAGDPAAFDAWSAGAALKRNWDPDAAEQATVQLKAAMTPEVLAGPGGAPSGAPIFVIGLPRSGSTLVEQILASHPEVEAVDELPCMAVLARGLQLVGITPEERTWLGELYLEAASLWRRQGAPRFVDKAPDNWRHIGLIALALPNARIVDVRRHPMATGLSCFSRLFASGGAWSYDLTDIGRHYRDYQGLMSHWDAVLPGKVTRVIYEDLVEDLDGGVRRLLAACDLSFDPACLRFWETRRAVRTASSEQVRRPLYRDGLDHWRRFEDRLEPLKEALGPALSTWKG